jgi:CxxC-x17-CxxC domain-containing protein
MSEFNRDSPRRSFGGGGSSGGGFRRDFGPREMHKATCSECGQECEVPFKPTEGKPVYCKECYRKKKAF